jgi:aspartyl-tRNA(Asn)/glutamyl-tRNA(Gln) amidotransferase subunit C
MAVTEADIRKIADLARLTIADEEVPSMAAQLNSILSHMDALTRIDTSSVEPMAVIGAGGAPLRDDVVSPIPMSVTAPMLAPKSEDGFILVPRLTTHEEL